MERREHQGGMEYQVGLLAGSVKAMAESLRDIRDWIETSSLTDAETAKQLSRLAERIDRLPCDERLSACRSQMSTIEKLYNSKARVCQGVKDRRAKFLAAGIGALGAGLVEAIYRLVTFVRG